MKVLDSTIASYVYGSYVPVLVYNYTVHKFMMTLLRIRSYIVAKYV